MRVPFLTRYYRLTGDLKYLDDAAGQFCLYREKLLIPELNLMSHVYYTDRKIANSIPLGQGILLGFPFPFGVAFWRLRRTAASAGSC